MFLFINIEIICKKIDIKTGKTYFMILLRLWLTDERGRQTKYCRQEINLTHAQYFLASTIITEICNSLALIVKLSTAVLKIFIYGDC